MKTVIDHPNNESIFWDELWKNRQTGWDIGYGSTAITNYLAQYANKDASILIPGCGNAHEAFFLVDHGFTNITLIDISQTAVELIKEKLGKFNQIKILCEDFFNHSGKYDLILEQTFFCAISPLKRLDYVEKMHSLLNENGKLVGLLFDKHFEKEGPLFGGTVAEYKTSFSPRFHINIMEKCYNSIKPRENVEVFINLTKRLVK